MILIGVDLPLPARIVICVAIATTGIVAIRRVFLLRGAGCLQALSWSAQEPEFTARAEDGGPEIPATLVRGSFRLGSSYLLLWLRTCSRLHAVFIDGNRQQVHEFRGLCRRLRWPPRVP